MWSEAEEIFKNCIPYYVLVFLPLFIIISPINPVSASHEFPIYRMQHYDLHGTAHGSRSAGINLEARSLTAWSTSRHCIVTKLQQLTVEHFRNIRQKAGALIIVLPRELAALNAEERQHFLLLEQAMMSQELTIPVYFAPWTPELDKIVEEVNQNIDASDAKQSGTEALFSSVTANGYQLVATPSTASARTNVKIASIQGVLPGYNQDGNIPTLAIVTHYDSFGVAPELSFGADSNASGVVVLLELLRLFSALYGESKTRGRYNLIFLLAGGGKINFQGSKKFLEDQLDVVEGNIIQDVTFVMCLDSLSSANSLYMHVSKPPKEGSNAALFFKALKSSAALFPDSTVDGVHKKIHLAEDALAWEHERFSLRRLPAFTISAIKNHREQSRYTILDTKESLQLDKLVQNTKVIAEALASHVYNLSGGGIFEGSMAINKAHMGMWLDYLTSQPRSPQLLCNKDNSLVAQLKDTFNKYLRDVKITYAITDKRDPDFVFYDATKGSLSVYSVKPAIFDLVLTIIIVVYLGAIYLFIQKFSHLYGLACKITGIRRMKQN